MTTENRIAEAHYVPTYPVPVLPKPPGPPEKEST